MKFESLNSGDEFQASGVRFTKITPRSAEHWGVTECARCGTSAQKMINARDEQGLDAHFCPGDETVEHLS